MSRSQKPANTARRPTGTILGAQKSSKRTFKAILLLIWITNVPLPLFGTLNTGCYTQDGVTTAISLSWLFFCRVSMLPEYVTYVLCVFASVFSLRDFFSEPLKPCVFYFHLSPVLSYST